jgi:hypothetical protein
VDPGHALNDVACPSASQCTGVDDGGAEITFNPQSPGTPSPVRLEAGHALPAVACVSITQCTALDDTGNELTFNPQSPGTPSPTSIDSNRGLDLTCPTSNQCTAIDTAGQQVTFFPLSRSEFPPHPIDTGAQLAAVACRTSTGCVAIDENGGAVEGDPRGTGAWTAVPVAGGALSAVQCPSPTECVAVEASGDVFTGTNGPLPPTPGTWRRPSISGTPEQTKTLIASPGAWSGGPTSYSYQWERCTSGGRRCAAIAGAVGRTRVLTTADVGHRLRVLVDAYNITGGGPTQRSAPTRTVRPVVSLALKQGSLAGVAGGAPRLALKLALPTGSPPLRTVTISLPRGVNVSHARRHAIHVVGTHRHLRFRLRGGGRRLKIICLSRTSGLWISVPAAVLSIDPSLSGLVRTHRLRAVRLLLLITARYGGRTRGPMKIPAR